MSPIKFEENIKKELEKRTIPVTKRAWERLQERLDPEPKSNKPNLFWVLGIAASLVLIFWVSKGILTDTNIEPTIVEVPKEETLPSKLEENKAVDVAPTEILVASNDEIEVEEVPDNSKEEALEISHKSVVLKENETRVATAITEEEVVIKMTFEDVKVQEVVAQIVEMKKNNTLVTNDEIDALLRTAQREIEVKQLLIENASTQNARNVNADALLYEVEMELDKSFRDKVFEELKIQFKSVKNAVAQRNN